MADGSSSVTHWGTEAQQRCVGAATCGQQVHCNNDNVISKEMFKSNNVHHNKVFKYTNMLYWHIAPSEPSSETSINETGLLSLKQTPTAQRQLSTLDTVKVDSDAFVFPADTPIRLCSSRIVFCSFQVSEMLLHFRIIHTVKRTVSKPLHLPFTLIYCNTEIVQILYTTITILQICTEALVYNSSTLTFTAED